MITWNELKHLDVKDIDLTKIDLTRFDVRNLTKFELPERAVDADRVFGFARDTAYAGVGVVVITAQKLDTQRRELTDQITARVRKLVDAVA